MFDSPTFAIVFCWGGPVLVAGFIGYFIGRGYRVRIDKF